MNRNESHARSVVKGTTWRVVASLTTMALVYAFTGDLVIVAEVGALEVIAKLLFYYLHERAWGAVAWGYVIDQGQRVRSVSTEATTRPE